MFLANETAYEQMRICPDVSVTLGQIHAFKTSIVIELAVVPTVSLMLSLLPSMLVFNKLAHLLFFISVGMATLLGSYPFKAV
jgi:hypothetical protein